MSQLKRNLVRAFVLSAVVAVALNLVAAGESFQADRWSVGLGYLVIAAGLGAALVIHWYSSHRQAPYRWRDERFVSEHVRDEDGDDPWDAWEQDFDDDWRDPRWRDDDD